MTRINDLLLTEQYWFTDVEGVIHTVFAKSLRLAKVYTRSKGLLLSPCNAPVIMLRGVYIHNATQFAEQYYFPEVMSI